MEGIKYITIILPVVLYGCVAWSLILRVVRKIFGSKSEGGENKIMNSIIFAYHQILSGW